MAAIINAMIVSIATIPSSNGAMVDGRWSVVGGLILLILRFDCEVKLARLTRLQVFVIVEVFCLSCSYDVLLLISKTML